MTSDPQDVADVATCIWFQVPYAGIQDLPTHDELSHRLGQRILEILQHDDVTRQLLEQYNARLLPISTIDFR